MLDETERLLFVGDAKVAENENAGTSATLERVFAYFQEFAELLGTREIDGGILAIATNTTEAAREWIPALNALAAVAGITARDGRSPTFDILSGSDQTHIVGW